MYEYDKEKINEQIEKLKPMTYLEWTRLREVIDEYFRILNNKVLLDNALTDEEVMEKVKKRVFPNSQ